MSRPRQHTLIIKAYLKGQPIRRIMADTGVTGMRTLYDILRRYKVALGRAKGRASRFSAAQRENMKLARSNGATLKGLGKKYRTSFQTVHRLTGGKRKRKFKPHNPWGE